MVKCRYKLKPPHRLPLSSSGDLRLVLHRQGGGPAAGEGDRFDFASKLDYQGAFKSSGQGHSSLSQNEGMDFGFSLGEARSINETAECKFTNEEEGAVERWEMELKQFLAGIESEPSPFVLDMPANDFYDMRQTVEVNFRG